MPITACTHCGSGVYYFDDYGSSDTLYEGYGPGEDFTEHLCPTLLRKKQKRDRVDNMIEAISEATILLEQEKIDEALDVLYEVGE